MDYHQVTVKSVHLLILWFKFSKSLNSSPKYLFSYEQMKKLQELRLTDHFSVSSIDSSISKHQIQIFEHKELTHRIVGNISCRHVNLPMYYSNIFFRIQCDCRGKIFIVKDINFDQESTFQDTDVLRNFSKELLLARMHFCHKELLCNCLADIKISCSLPKLNYPNS